MLGVWLIPLFPLLGFLINGTWYALGQSAPAAKKAGATSTGIIASTAIFASFVVSVILFLHLTGVPQAERIIENVLFSWIQVGDFNIDVAFRFDSLSALFCLVITGVGTLIHIYSIGYMHDDETPGKYFAYLNLFCFAMLILVLGGSLPLMFLGWEGVGLCSYLLIGYWYMDTEKASAGKKAFVVNRIGDFGFLIGMFLIFTTFGTMDFEALRLAVAERTAVESGIITAICLFLFLGCTGKSAQIPLYVWLPDAMAGPTPVSALIHAATMVTSGIYLITRLNFLYTLSPTALFIVAAVGGVTAFFAATMAFVQTDIKKVLAYSTVSQLGYMFLGCGVAAFSAGVFHVITHAFFKALLFMGSGSVILGMHHEQDIMKMGGLWDKMRKTGWVFLIGSLALAGFPGVSGFWSKDAILFEAFYGEHGSMFLWALGSLTALMTAFYTTRLFVLTFMGKPRFDEHHHHVHESPNVVLIPLYILAVLSLFGGFIGFPFANWLTHWLAPIIGEQHGHAPVALEVSLLAFAGVVAIIGILAAKWFYSDLSKSQNFQNKFSGLHKVVFNKWYIDEIYESAFVKSIFKLSVALWKGFDVAVVDRIVLFFGGASVWSGDQFRRIHTGSIQVYAVMIFLGLLIALGYLTYGLV